MRPREAVVGLGFIDVNDPELESGLEGEESRT